MADIRKAILKIRGVVLTFFSLLPCRKDRKANSRFSEYSPVANPFGWYGETKKLYEDFQEFGIRQIRERRFMSDNPALWKIPKLWIP